MCVYRERSENKNQSKQLSKRGNCTCTDWDEKLDNVKEMNGSARRRTILFHFCFLQSNPSPTPCLFPHLFSLIPYHSSPIPHCNPIPYPHPSFSIRCTLSSIPIRYPLSPFPLFPILLSSIPFLLFPIPYSLSPVPFPLSLFPIPLSSIPFPYPTISYPLLPIPLFLIPYSLSTLSPIPFLLFPTLLSSIPFPLSLIPYFLSPIPFPLFL